MISKTIYCLIGTLYLSVFAYDIIHKSLLAACIMSLGMSIFFVFNLMGETKQTTRDAG